jgi:hypothetical protein
MKKQSHGGKRSRSGRKPLNPEDKKVGLTVYVQQSKIDQVGGMEEAKKKVINFINT